jgi:hypothetical protein
MTDILMTGSRSIFAISFLVLFYNKQFIEKKIFNSKTVFIPVLIGLAAYIIVFFTPLGNTLIVRFDTQEDSIQARMILLDYFMNNIKTFELGGLGAATESRFLVNERNEPIILENPWIILFLEVSYIALFYLVFLAFVVLKGKYQYLFALFILVLTVFNSFGVKSNFNYMLFFLLAYAYQLKYSQQSQKSDETKLLV